MISSDIAKPLILEDADYDYKLILEDIEEPSLLIKCSGFIKNFPKNIKNIIVEVYSHGLNFNYYNKGEVSSIFYGNISEPDKKYEIELDNKAINTLFNFMKIGSDTLARIFINDDPLIGLCMVINNNDFGTIKLHML